MDSDFLETSLRNKPETLVAADKIEVTDSFVCVHCETNVYIFGYLEPSVVEALILHHHRHRVRLQVRLTTLHR